jgi:hypothetical protein
MRLTRTVAAVSLVMSLSVLAGCSGDGDDSGDPKTSPSGSGASSGTPTDKPSKSHTPTAVPSIPDAKSCDVEAEITGAFEASWTGDGQFADNDQQSTFIAQDGAVILNVLTSGAEQVLVTVINDNQSYSVTPGDKGVEVDGSSVSIDADAAQGGTQNTIHVTASFDC